MALSRGVRQITRRPRTGSLELSVDPPTLELHTRMNSRMTSGSKNRTVIV
jgi:hypothetical protein